MIIVNCGFSRNVRVPHRKTRIECRNVQGIRVHGHRDLVDGMNIRKILMKFKPPGEGWCVSGYCMVEK